MPTANNPVKFVSTTLANYKALTEKNSDTCYFCSDTNSFFIGDVSYSHGVAFFNSTPTADDIKDLASGTLLIVEPNTSNGNCFEMYYLVGNTITTIGKFENVANKSSKNILELLDEDDNYDPTTDNIHYFDGAAAYSLYEEQNKDLQKAVANLISQQAIVQNYESGQSSTKLIYCIDAVVAAIKDLSANKTYVDNKVTTYVDDKIGNIDTILDSINGD